MELCNDPDPADAGPRTLLLAVHDRPLHLALPHPHQPSPSSIAHLSQAHIISRESAGAVGAEHSSYSQELEREEEEEYLQNLVATFHPHHHHHHQYHPHQQQQQHPTLSEDHSHRPYQMHPEQQPPPLHSPLVDQAYGAHHPQVQDHHHYLVGESPTMIKYGSPSLLHPPPPLHLE